MLIAAKPHALDASAKFGRFDEAYVTSLEAAGYTIGDLVLAQAVRRTKCLLHTA